MYETLSTQVVSRVYPAEWSPQSAILMAWPHQGTDWAEILDSVADVYVRIVSAISQHERVVLLCQDDAHQGAITHQLKQAGVNIRQIIFQPIQYNDTWTRDYGPLSILQNGQPQLLDFVFNGWGNKFTADDDDQVNQILNARGVWSDIPLESIDYILEGGSVDTDGQGTLMTTSACLLNDNRNPQANKESVEVLLADKLGCQRLLWLDHGYLAGDDTDSHIDTLARFCSVDSIVYMACEQPDDEHFNALKQMEEEIKTFRTGDGRAYQLFPINIPPPIYDEDKQRLPASYVNFLVINSAVLVPVYGDEPSDRAAIKQLTRAFPRHEIIAIDCKPLIMQHGSLHCVTMQWIQGVI